jgi:hypothetical protein
VKFRNPWVDPRVVRVRPEQVQAYLNQRGWRGLGPASDPHLLRYERTDGGDDGPTLFVPRKVDQGPGLQWVIELIEELARFEDRWATAVVEDILQQTGDKGTAATGQNGPQNSETRLGDGTRTPSKDKEQTGMDVRPSKAAEALPGAWVRKRILIWGKTRPELSKSHKETVCTGGIFEDTKGFVRLYPIPLRYLDGEQAFKKYQWIEADVRKATKDPRPESYNVRCDTIELGETIPTTNGDWSRRAEWVLQPNHIFRSVEALQAAWEKDGTSIGMVKPLEVLHFRFEKYPEEERRDFWSKYKAIVDQQELPFDPDAEPPVRPLSPPDFRFQIAFRCDDPNCPRDHLFTVFDWEVDALYHSLRRDGETPEQACEKVVDKLRDEVCGPGKDTFFFLGNMAAHPHTFTIVGLWYPKKQQARQPDLFDNLSAG